MNKIVRILINDKSVEMMQCFDVRTNVGTFVYLESVRSVICLHKFVSKRLNEYLLAQLSGYNLCKFVNAHRCVTVYSSVFGCKQSYLVVLNFIKLFQTECFRCECITLCVKIISDIIYYTSYQDYITTVVEHPYLHSITTIVG